MTPEREMEIRAMTLQEHAYMTWGPLREVLEELDLTRKEDCVALISQRHTEAGRRQLDKANLDERQAEINRLRENLNRCAALCAKMWRRMRQQQNSIHELEEMVSQAEERANAMSAQLHLARGDAAYSRQVLDDIQRQGTC